MAGNKKSSKSLGGSMPSIMKDWSQVNEGAPMANPNLTSSASLHPRLSAFGGLFIVLTMAFHPLAAFVLTVLASVVLAKL